MRNLATIQVISAIKPIPGADAIECARILGWDVVIKKSDGFQVGDKICYCEVDSIMPDKPEFDFLRNSKGIMMRIRTVKLRGQISQGIAFPLSILPEGEYREGQDVTEILGVKKWEPDEPHVALRGKQKSSVKIQFPKWIPQFMRKFMVRYFLELSRKLFNRKMGQTFPPWIPKTDETRVQVLGEMLKKYEGTPCAVTEKCDGSSCTIYMKDGEFGVCSRNIDLQEDETNTFWKAVNALNLKRHLKCFDFNIALQGELVGEGIQGNKYKIKGHKIFFFNVFNIDEQRYLDHDDAVRFINAMGLEFVPVLEENHLLRADSDYYVDLAKGKSWVHDTLREGIVIRPMEDTIDYSQRGLQAGRVSFKAINPEFLLRHDDN